MLFSIECCYISDRSCMAGSDSRSLCWNKSQWGKAAVCILGSMKSSAKVKDMNYPSPMSVIRFGIRFGIQVRSFQEPVSLSLRMSFCHPILGRFEGCCLW